LTSTTRIGASDQHDADWRVLSAQELFFPQPLLTTPATSKFSLPSSVENLGVQLLGKPETSLCDKIVEHRPYNRDKPSVLGLQECAQEPNELESKAGGDRTCATFVQEQKVSPQVNSQRYCLCLAGV